MSLPSPSDRNCNHITWYLLRHSFLPFIRCPLHEWPIGIDGNRACMSTPDRIAGPSGYQGRRLTCRGGKRPPLPHALVL